MARSALDRARQTAPHIAEIYIALAACYLKLNKKSDAKQMVQEALQRDPNNSEANRLKKQL